MLRSLVLIGCVLGIGCASAPKRAPTGSTESASEAPRPGSTGHPDFLSPADVMKRLEESKVQYRLEPKDSPPGGWADQLWPQRVEPVTAPRVVVEGGQRVIQEWPENPKAQELVNQGEVHFRDRRYAEAAKLYAQAVEACPDCYLARAYLGDARLFGGDPEAALVDYRKATELNPYDYRLYYFQGSALARLGRLAEARDAFASSLVLNPRNPVLRQFFRENRGLGMALQGDILVPRGFAHEEGNDVMIEFDPDYGAAWLAFANCKALWIGEPSHREEMTGTTERHFSSIEETECLVSTAMVHVTQSENADATQNMDPSLDRLMAVIEDGMVTELVLFELATRVHPQYTLTLDDADRERLKAYVLEHVLLPVRSLSL
ncbi:tetratricopeptide repeat protein [Hyalangium gracile]|uniref:tetratricopeptide repeat protein n=1 Tax=Hyalangium gracile TaxID=394092 RepID=UPI001CCA848B|nr:tetratricopeptide repeat protein [Hyalangium gracile]